MPRPRTTTAMLDLTGQLAHDPQRHTSRANEAQPSAPIGTPPKHLSATQKKLWKELVSIAIPGVLGNADSWLLEMTVKVMERVRSGAFANGDLTILRQCLAQLGMTPADRSRVTAMKQTTPKNDEWSDLIQ